MRWQRAVRRRPDLVLAQREVSRPRLQMRRRIAFAISLVAVALRAVFGVELLARLALRLGPDVLSRRAHRSCERETHRGDHGGDAPAPARRPSTLLRTALSLSPFDAAQGDLEPVERSKGRSAEREGG